MLKICILTIQKSAKKNLLKKKEYLRQIPRRLCYQNIIRKSAKSSFIRILQILLWYTRCVTWFRECHKNSMKVQRDAGKKTVDEKLSLFKGENQS